MTALPIWWILPQRRRKKPILFTEEKTVIPELAELYQQNSDLAGWIRIEDANINYPVMHTITLSTCEYSRTNGRLVVVAKRISE